MRSQRRSIIKEYLNKKNAEKVAALPRLIERGFGGENGSAGAKMPTTCKRRDRCEYLEHLARLFAAAVSAARLITQR